MRVLQVISGISNLAAGPSYTVPRLCEALSSRGAQVELHTLAPVPAHFQSACYDIHAYPISEIPILKQLGWSAPMLRGLTTSAASVSVLHNQGLWMMPNFYAYRAACSCGVPFVVSPRGMLSPWSLGHSKWKKRLVWWTQQKRALRSAACFHATAESELEDLRRLGFSAPVAVIPNGIDVPIIDSQSDPVRERRLLFLARIHKKKGVDVLLRAWKRLASQHREWKLTIAGPDDGGYLNEMNRLASELDIERVEFRGAVYGEDKRRLLLNSSLYVLPTHSENFGMTVAEALAHGVPAIVTKGAPWEGLNDRDCGWWIDLDEDGLTACLDQAMAMDAAKLREKGERGRRWMDEKYSWSSVAEKMQITYQWLLAGGILPDWVEV